MKSFWNHNVVELIFHCYICISVLDLWPFKKKRMPISLFKNFIIYKPKSDTAKWRNFSIKMSSNWFFNVTFVYQFLICDHLKKIACQYDYFKISLYISQSPTRWQNDVILASRCRQIDFSMLHLYISFRFVTI